jgi:hypothetical protein
MFQSPATTPLRDRIAAALAERGLDPDDPLAGDDELWAPEDLPAAANTRRDQPESRLPESALGLIRGASIRR